MRSGQKGKAGQKRGRPQSLARGPISEQSRKIPTEKRLLHDRGLPYARYAAPPCLVAAAFPRFCAAAQSPRDLCLLRSPALCAACVIRPGCA